MAGTSLAAALAQGPVVLDGGLATQLESQGHDLGDHLWSARLLRDDPAAIVAAHAAFLAAGARVATTASYQASVAGFVAAGLDRRTAQELMQSSVHLARQSLERALPAGEPAWVAASVGPYGAVLADGSEYRGDYGLTVGELRRFHRPRLQVLAETGPDVLACETVPCLAEAEALLAEVDGMSPDVPVWLSLTVDGEHTRRGEPVADAFRMAADVDAVVAVGVNCCDPRDLREVVAVAASLSGKPVVVYPNSGDAWDAARRAWVGEARPDDPSTGWMAAATAEWIEAGAALVGGCCRVGPAGIRAVAQVVHERQRERHPPATP